MALYSDKVMDHFMNPRNVGEIADADGVGEVGNAKCGDIMKMYLKIKDGKIDDVKFETFGCASAIASSSMATELIKGKTLAQIMQEEPENCDGYLDDMVELQLSIHAKKVTGISKLKDKLREEIESLDVIDHIKRYDLLTRLDSTPKHVKLCHGNFGPENIVVTDDNKVYIVDWIGASAGNASADVAKTYLKLALTSTETAEKYLNLFCKKTNTAKTYVQEWLPIMAASTLAKGVTSKEEKDLLFTWLDVVDYS